MPAKKIYSSLESPELLAKLNKIKLLALDIDGILTNGQIFWLKEQGWTRYWSVRDGHGLLMLAHAGFKLAIITAGDSQDVRARAERLAVQHAYFGVTDKLQVLDQILRKENYTYEQIAYMGDELMDIPVLERVGFSATVPEAVSEVHEFVDYVTTKTGGDGAVREVVDAIRKINKIGFTAKAY